MNQIIIHVDMDAFYASVEIRDNPELRGKPLIIGSLPQERGVVATCSYEARKYGVHSAMNIKEAYRLCPTGIFMHPNFEKYRAVSDQLHTIWNMILMRAATIMTTTTEKAMTATAMTAENIHAIKHSDPHTAEDATELNCNIPDSRS